jgi:hypothetical protein
MAHALIRPSGTPYQVRGRLFSRWGKGTEKADSGDCQPESPDGYAKPARRPRTNGLSRQAHTLGLCLIHEHGHDADYWNASLNADASNGSKSSVLAAKFWLIHSVTTMGALKNGASSVANGKCLSQ